MTYVAASSCLFSIVAFCIAAAGSRRVAKLEQRIADLQRQGELVLTAAVHRSAEPVPGASLLVSVRCRGSQPVRLNELLLLNGEQIVSVEAHGAIQDQVMLPGEAAHFSFGVRAIATELARTGPVTLEVRATTGLAGIGTGVIEVTEDWSGIAAGLDAEMKARFSLPPS